MRKSDYNIEEKKSNSRYILCVFRFFTKKRRYKKSPSQVASATIQEDQPKDYRTQMTLLNIESKNNHFFPAP